MINCPYVLSTKSNDIGLLMNTLYEKALNHLWYPCSQMKDYVDLPPIEVSSAEGPYLTLKNGDKIIDAISSWWCKSLGHRHPRIVNAIKAQMDKYIHIIGTNTLSEPLVELSEKLSQLHPGLEKVFYTGDGSCAVEVAMKMSIHARRLQNQPGKTQFAALKNGYHGETLATLSISDLGLYKAPYDKHALDVHFIEPVPYVLSMSDPIWHDASEAWDKALRCLLPLKDKLTAIVLEPILQGAAGMKIYSQDFLKRLSLFAKEHDIHLICDEIMTGFGRTGKTLALEHADIQADFICLSKALTGGTLPLSAVLASNDIYDLFYDDYESNKAFLHSNTYCGHALAACAALEAVKIHQEDNLNQMANDLGLAMRNAFLDIAEITGRIDNISQMGAMVSGELVTDKNRAGFAVFKEAIKLGAFLRPLGNRIYWLPPINTAPHVIQELKDITIKAIKAALN